MESLLSSTLRNGMSKSQRSVWLVPDRGLLANGRRYNLCVRRFGTCPEVSPYWLDDVDSTYGCGV